MRKYILLAFGCLVALPALLFGQNPIPAERKFAIIEIFDNDSYLSVTKYVMPADTATLYLPEDGVTNYIGTTTWTTPNAYDTIWTEKERYDDATTAPLRWTITNIFKAANTAKPGIYNKSFTAVQVTSTASTASTTFIGDRVEFFGERFEGHGNVKVFIDNQQVATLYQGAVPWVTDFSRMQPSFYYVFPKDTPTSPPGQHTLRLETEPSNQYIIDMIRVMNYTLKLRP
jgi:archaellum component FlaF (FlaF/FlaG flagellin family)